MIPEVVKLLPTILNDGRLGIARISNFYLFRFESRIIWLEIIEKGYEYFGVSYENTISI